MAKDLKGLIAELQKDGVLRTPDIVDAFRSIDRKDFVSPEYNPEAYSDQPLPIGHSQTISQPYTVAFMLELLELKRGEKILDIGSGSAWTTALLAHCVGAGGRVYGIEIVPELVTLGTKNIKKYRFPNVEIKKATSELGYKREAPYDKILISAGDLQMPQELVEQLKIGGIMVVPILNGIWKITRTGETETTIEEHEGFAFVPLVRE